VDGVVRTIAIKTLKMHLLEENQKLEKTAGEDH
jgi:hypothetical protein